MLAEKILAVAPKCAMPLALALESEMPKYGINTIPRQAMFLAQCCHESGGLTQFVENLSYSAEGLMRTWPSRFRALAAAIPYARNPERLANHVYADRLENGNEASGDGWKFRGRGIIQLTGRVNYRKAGDGIGVDLIGFPDGMLLPKNSAAVACWFWQSNGLNSLADTGQFQAITKRINGGLNGEADRERWLRDIRAVLTE
jgi:putative chitinase